MRPAGCSPGIPTRTECSVSRSSARFTCCEGCSNEAAPRSGVWRHDDKLLQVGAAPVRNEEGGIVGALLVGYDLSNGYAKREARLIGHDLLFITDEGIYSTSTSVEVRDALQKALYAPPLDAETGAALQGKPTQPWGASSAAMRTLA